ncbi:hypothetical protein LMG28688_07245 [Paraburkholderia caffeinitolerans]|uniref:DUF6708 domain-containing protein n=1 Tax=Paraburkholderia caffeinitolerans TaxID=1723730 RepID=A0A6J5H275_9BURK|nr:MULTISPECIES: DUF6708 domain-containing protein [Paraburkholderia]CAB3810406.1 hypothetical protein LMG28688_07245 [Paraburkholderia caffeinitolerans]
MYDYLTKVSINRPVSEDEAKRRLDVHKPAASEAHDKHMVFHMNDVYLDICDTSYQQLGWATLAFLVGVPAFGYFGWQISLFAIQAPIFWTLVVPCVGGLVFCAAILFKDCFNYRHKTIRFNRKNRMVYAFRHNGKGGVVEVPWDEAFFFAHRQMSSPFNGGAPTVLRCYVLAEDGKTIVNTFSFGKRMVVGGSETSAWGQRVFEQLLTNFEFVRKFMEDGPESVPPIKKYLSEGPSLSASASVLLQNFQRLRNSNAVLWVLMTVIALPMCLMVLLHYIAQLTSREPVWPDDVQRASQPGESPRAAVA